MRNLALSQLAETMWCRLPARQNLAKTWSGCSPGVSLAMTSCRRLGGTIYLGVAVNKRVLDTLAGFSATCTNVGLYVLLLLGQIPATHSCSRPGYCRRWLFTCGRKGPGSLDLQPPETADTPLSNWYILVTLPSCATECFQWEAASSSVTSVAKTRSAVTASTSKHS